VRLGSSSDWYEGGVGLLTKEKFQNESDEGVHGFIQPFCSRIHITYSAMAIVKTANAIEKAACLRMVIPKTVARSALQDFCFSRPSDKQREQFDHTNSDHEHCECHESYSSQCSLCCIVCLSVPNPGGREGPNLITSPAALRSPRPLGSPR
jgi:hypothetical protein